MKKFIISALLIAAAAVSANAQVYLGGSLGVSVGNQKNFTDGYPKSVSPAVFNLAFAPEVGYTINEKMAVGATLNLQPSSRKYYVEGNDPTTSESAFEWNINPYFRYKVCGFGKFGVWGEAYVSFGTGSSKYNNSITTTYTKSITYGVGICPVLTYDVNEKLALVCNLNILKLGWDGSSRTNTNSLTDATTHYTTSSFAFAASGWATATIGMFYKF